MSATMIREKRQTTLPIEVCEAAGLEPGDQIEWSFEGGAIRGEKLVPEPTEEIDIDDVDPKTLLPREGRIALESIAKAVRADRDRQR